MFQFLIEKGTTHRLRKRERERERNKTIGFINSEKKLMKQWWMKWKRCCDYSANPKWPTDGHWRWAAAAMSNHFWTPNDRFNLLSLSHFISFVASLIGLRWLAALPIKEKNLGTFKTFKNDDEKNAGKITQLNNKQWRPSKSYDSIE